MINEFAPDLILYNGRIVTVDSSFRVVEAVAVYDGKFCGYRQQYGKSGRWRVIRHN